MSSTLLLVNGADKVLLVNGTDELLLVLEDLVVAAEPSIGSSLGFGMRSPSRFTTGIRP